jgi:hypothetical protein
MAVKAFFVILILFFVAGAVADATSWLMTKHLAQGIANDATLQGCRAGIEYWDYINEGKVRLAEPEARAKAVEVVTSLAPWPNYDYAVYVLPEGGEIPEFSFSTSRPSVAVAITVPVEGFIFSAQVRAFAAAGAEEEY